MNRLNDLLTLVISATIMSTGCDISSSKPDTSDTAVDTDIEADADTDADADADADADTDADTDKNHDCVSYNPTSQEQDLSEDWFDNDDEDWYTVTTPADPGGGIVTLSIVADNSIDRPWLNVYHGSKSGRALYSGSNEGESDASRIDIAFEAAASETFYIEARLSGGSASLPSSYTMTWSFASKVDCYEHNDEQTDARQVPTNTPLESYLIGGYQDQYLFSEAFDDWYYFVLEETSEVTILTTQMPSDLWVDLRLYDESGARLGEWGPPDGYGGLVSSTPLTLKSGTYSFYFSPFYAPTGDVEFSNIETLDHWDTMHRFEVQATPK